MSGVNAALSGPIHANCHMQDAHKRAAKINEAPRLSRDVCSYLAAGFRPNTYRSCSASPQHGQVRVQSRASSLKKQLNHQGKQAQLTSISLKFLFDFLIINTAIPHSVRTGDVNIKINLYICTHRSWRYPLIVHSSVGSGREPCYLFGCCTDCPQWPKSNCWETWYIEVSTRANCT